MKIAIEQGYCVDGHEFEKDACDQHNESSLLGDGQFPPFRVFDIAAQDYLPGEYQTRTEAEAALLAAGAKIED